MSDMNTLYIHISNAGAHRHRKYTTALQANELHGLGGNVGIL